MKTLVIAEKPSVGRDIARVLHCSKKGNGCLEGNQYVVTWALGHLVTLQDPEDYDKKYKEWKLEVLPMMPEKLKIKVIPQTGKTMESTHKAKNIRTRFSKSCRMIIRKSRKSDSNRRPLHYE